MASVQKVENKINMIVFQSEGITMVMCGRASEPPALPRSGLRTQHRPTHRTAALAQPWGAASWPLVFPVAVGLLLSPLPVASPFRPSSASHGWTHCSDPCCLGLSLPACSKASPGHSVTARAVRVLSWHLSPGSHISSTRSGALSVHPSVSIN